MNQKISTAIGFNDRIHRLSDVRFTARNNRRLIESLEKNDYPLRLVHRLINRYHEENKYFNRKIILSSIILYRLFRMFLNVYRNPILCSLIMYKLHTKIPITLVNHLQK